MTYAGLLSDSHGFLPEEMPRAADFFIHAGDLCPDAEQAEWMLEWFFPWVRNLQRPFYLTWGNHDFVGESLYAQPRGEIALALEKDWPANLHVIVDDVVETAGKRVYFTPWTPRCGPWAWQHDGTHVPYTVKLDATIDVLVSHGPPHGRQDRTDYGGRAGCPLLKTHLETLATNVKLVICGHIHEGFGSSRGDRYDVVNVSQMNTRYEPVNSPVVWDWDEIGR